MRLVGSEMCIRDRDTATMLHEMATVGVAMSLLVTAVWGIMLLVVKIKETKISKEKELME